MLLNQWGSMLRCPERPAKQKTRGSMLRCPDRSAKQKTQVAYRFAVRRLRVDIDNGKVKFEEIEDKTKPFDPNTQYPWEEEVREFGQHVTADHIYVTGAGSLGFDDQRYAVTVYDIGTRWRESYPVGPKSAMDAQRSLQQFAGGCVHTGVSFGLCAGADQGG